MAGTGRKRKILALTVLAAPEHKDGMDLKLSHDKLKKPIQSQKTQSAETERSHYFTKNDLQHRLGEEFFNQSCIRLAKAFLGKVLVRRCADGTELRGRIVETEAYLGGEDKASHSAGGKRTERNTAMFMKPGTIYVYPIYGIYLCMNVSSEGEGAAVLLRSLEPLQGQPVMRQLRTARRKDGARQLKDKELCNGPSKLCQALDIHRCFDRRDLASDHEVWLERDPNANPAEPSDIVAAPRIGIESHGEWAKRPWRFYLRGHPCVSVVSKDAEIQSLSGNVMNDLGPSDVQSDKGQHNVKRT
ncbi:DNA-3-methyladenine glycosylase isoform X1 [Micropterus dolomieu]|uniref:DNA-3-methyladenine glycosylase isoform X1 n=2 Tax=Micropterus dolomieu TaxID=147949 RepID=UPI001E8DCC72|nr:DNA-3-methyladenine glycosylase isoform X1 [Micropterus dolomieu]